MLYLVPTPIGNLGDITERALEVLKQADVLACEDTRRTRQLLSHFQIPRPKHLLSYREGTEGKAGSRILGFLESGYTVAVCSDGGCPGICDPGYRIISLAVENGMDFEVLPGPSAVHVALLSSGLSTSSYTFKGYPPRKAGALRRFFEEEKDLPHTLVFFESPYRTHKALIAAQEVLGDRKAAVCVELTKNFENITRGFLDELCDEFDGVKVKGEVAIVVAGNNPKFSKDESLRDVPVI